MSDKVSVAMNVYDRENPVHFDIALQSLYDQTFKDFEIILAVDGPVTKEIHDVIRHWEQKFGPRMKCIYLEKNLGIAGSLNVAIQACSHDLIARMDSDDYSVPDRLEKQRRFMLEHPKIDVLGSQMGEFESDPHRVHMLRKVPILHDSISKAMWLKTPINHVTVMYRKKAIISVGGYDPAYGNDDFLWAKMVRDGFHFRNLDDCLVHARVGENMRAMIKRRATLELFRWNCKIRTYLFQHRIISPWHYFLGLMIALGIFVLPLGLKCYLFRKSRVRLA
ncbi:MAG: glycosyltransferase [Deltaproteobacteria bacterium]|nr:glycosyltransferase [Deltaproteobacteria bacterium]